MNTKTKRSPDLTGAIKIHVIRYPHGTSFVRLAELLMQFGCLALLRQDGDLFNVQLGKYEPPRQYHGSENIFDLLAKKQEGEVD
jgi:hypothetical protein